MVLAYNTSVHESTGFTPYRLMFGREAILPLDAVLKLETSPPQRGAQSYPDYVIQQKKQLEETEHIVRENLKRAQKTQKAYYDSKCHGQWFCVGDRVWYRNRTRSRRKKFIKPWCGPCRVVKAMSDVTFRIEEERRKAGERRRRKVVHFNYLKPCFTPPPEVPEKPPQATTSRGAAQSESLRDVLQPTQAQGAAGDTGGVELEWLENPVIPATDGHETPQVQEVSGTLNPDAQPADVPYQLEVPSVNNESFSELSHTPVRPTHERREPLWLQDYVRTVAVYPALPFTLVGTVAI